MYASKEIHLQYICGIYLITGQSLHKSGRYCKLFSSCVKNLIDLRALMGSFRTEKV